MSRAGGVEWNGLEEYRAELRQLTDECQGDAAKLIEAEVNGAYVTISQVYGAHRHTGTLQNRLRISSLAVGSRVYGLVLKSGSPIAWLFDHGSQARHWTGGKSTGRMWGKTPNPPLHIFGRTVAQARRRLTAQYHDLLRRRGAVSVTGE